MYLKYFGLLLQLYACSLALEFELDCTECPQSCNNDCFAIFAAAKPATLTYPGPATVSTTEDKRRLSGCTQSNGNSACGVNGIDPYKGAGDSCDEYPYASVDEGGTDSILRCVDSADNRKEGALLSGFLSRGTAKGGCGSAPCTFDLVLMEGTYKFSPYCVNDGGTNDGNEFKLKDGAYVNAKMLRSDVGSGYEDFVPNSGLVIPPHKRREYLLSNGRRVLLLSRDMERDFNGTMVSTADGGIAYMVKELLGQEKSKWFQPPKELDSK